MSKDAKEAVEILEKLKEVFKYHYDYYKHMTTLNAGSILIIIALLEGIFKEPKGIVIILVSIVCFVLSLICSLIIMSMMGNLALYMAGVYAAFIAKDIKGIEKISDRAKSTHGKTKDIGILNTIFFLLGIVMLVCFAFINFL